MAGRDRVTAIARARERQRRIEHAATRATKAQAGVERAKQARETTIAKADARVAEAEQAAAVEVANLTAVTGSAEATAEILGISPRQTKRAITDTRGNGQ